MSIVQEIRSSFKQGSILTRLIYINIGVFLIFRLLQLFMLLGGAASEAIVGWLHFFSVPSEPARLLQQPWTLLTYMFLHFDFLHLLFNVLYLYWFGRLFLHYIGPGPFLKTYVLGGLAGAVFYLVSYNLLPAFSAYFGSSFLLGASASAMAILFALARYRPEATITLLFFGEVRLKYVALVALLIDLISIPTLNNTGGHLAHLGGAAAGLWLGYVWSLKGLPAQGRPAGTTFSDETYSTPRKSSFRWPFGKKSKLSVAHKRPLSDLEYNAIKIRRQQELDRILEKIKQSGYESLSSAEKKTLFEASKD